MITPDLLGPLAASTGLLMALAPLRQLRRMLLRAQADDVSLPFLIVIAIGASFYAAYGLALADWYLLLPNAVGVATNSLSAAVAYAYKRQL